MSSSCVPEVAVLQGKWRPRAAPGWVQVTCGRKEPLANPCPVCGRVVLDSVFPVRHVISQWCDDC